MLNAIPAPLRTVIYLAIVGALVILATRYINKVGAKAGI